MAYLHAIIAAALDSPTDLRNLAAVTLSCVYLSNDAPVSRHPCPVDLADLENICCKSIACTNVGVLEIQSGGDYEDNEVDGPAILVIFPELEVQCFVILSKLSRR